MLLATLLLMQTAACGGMRGPIVSSTGTLARGSRSDGESLDRRLARIEREIAESEARAARARDEARLQECRAARSRRFAELAAQTAACWERAANSARCDAAQSERRSRGTILGCLLGIGVAIATGGALGPAALGGCGGGYMLASASEQECERAPSCDIDAVAADQQNGEIPLCGGRLGLVVADAIARGRGLRVRRASSATARSLRISEGDVIVEVNGQRVETLDHGWSRESDAGEASVIDVTVVRERTPHRLRGAMDTRAQDRPDSISSILGVELVPDEVEYLEGATIVGLETDHVEGLELGDVIVRIGDEVVWSARALRRAISDLPTDRTVPVYVRRGETIRVVHVLPMPRGEGTGL